MARTKSGWISTAIFLLVAGAIVAGAVWYFRKDKSAPEFITTPVSRGDIVQAVTATGNLTPLVNVQVGSQISGRIEAIYADFNATVKSNQVIAQIDPSTYQVAVLRAEAQLSNAVANLTLAKVQASRAVNLFQNKLIPAAEHDTALAQLQQAEADVRSSQATLASANVDLSRCTIVAPVDGVVISRNVDVGQTVAASFNTPTLFLIANDLSKMQIAALVSEADIGGVETGQDATFTVDAYPYRTFRGTVTQIRYGAITNQNVVSYSVIIDVNNEDLKLLPSMTATVSVILQERSDVVRIPNAALRFRPPESLTGTNSTQMASASPGMGRPAPGGREGQGRPRADGRMAGPGGGGPVGPGGPGRGGRGRDGGAGDRFSQRTVYVLDKNAGSSQPSLKPVSVRTGISDGVTTEVLEGLKEGDEVVTSVISTDMPAAGGPSNPFGGGRPGGFRRF